MCFKNRIYGKEQKIVIMNRITKNIHEHQISKENITNLYNIIQKY
jgi:hypothetical protein